MRSILGRKLGMTQVFEAGGIATGVTVIEAGPCIVTQVKTPEKDGYTGVQLGWGDTVETQTHPGRARPPAQEEAPPRTPPARSRSRPQ